MSKRKISSEILYWIVVVASVLLGSIYLFGSQFMPYHSAAVGLPWSELDEGMQTLLLALMRVAGGGWIALAAAIASLILFAFRRDAAWAYWVIPAVALIYYTPNLYATLLVTIETPATAPWYGNAAAVASSIVGFALSPRPPRGKQ